MPENENVNSNEDSETVIDGGGDSTSTISISIVNAKDLSDMDSPEDGLSFIMVDKATNTGYLLNYDRLAEIIYNKLYSDDMPEDGIKFVVIE